MVEWKKLGEIGDVCMCKRIMKNQTFDKGDVPFYKIGTFGGNADAFISKDLFHEYKSRFSFPQKGEILLSASGTIGRTVVYNGEDAYFQDSNIVWISNDETQVTNAFLYYCYQIVDWKIDGGTIKRLYNYNLKNTIIPIPSLEEQKRIVGILDTFTASIDNLKEQIAQRRKQYEYYRDQLLDLEGKDIKEVLSFGNDFQLKARIGWQGLTKKEYKETGDYKLVTGTDFTRNLRIDFDNCVYVDKERYEQDEYIQLKVGDVLITKDGTLGKVAYIDILEKPATLNGGVFVVRDPKNRVLPKFLMFYLTSYHFKKWMQQNHTTGSIQHLTQKLLSSFTIPVFSLEEQQHIVEILDTFEASIQNLEAQLSQREKQYEYYRNKLLTFE